MVHRIKQHFALGKSLRGLRNAGQRPALPGDRLGRVAAVGVGCVEDWELLQGVALAPPVACGVPVRGEIEVTFMHVLGGVSLLIVVALSTTVRAGIGLGEGDAASAQLTADEPEVEVAGVAEVTESEPGPVELVAPLRFGPMLDRMRP